MARHKEAVEFDVARLRRDLDDKAPKWAAFDTLAKVKGLSVSYDTFRRAKNDGFATLASLGTIARALGHTADRYLRNQNQKTEVAFDLSGQWMVIYLERPARMIVRTWEKLHVKQNGEKLLGEYDFVKTDEPDCPARQSVYKMRARLFKDLVTGNFWVGGRPSADGIGTFQLKVRPSGAVAEGFCSFYGDDGLVAVSHTLWIRSDGSHEAIYQLGAAEKLVAASQIFFEVPANPG